MQAMVDHRSTAMPRLWVRPELAQAILVVAGGSVAGQRGLARSLQAIDQASITLRAAALSGD
jgi:hypothetical protein